MKKGRVLITSYTNPDLDGTACAIAYAEYLQKQGYDAKPAFFGTPFKEALFVLDNLGILLPESAENLISDYEKIILVDASDTVGISSEINPLKVSEIVDHRKANEAEKFSNAKVQIELVGAAATLIAEKFFQEKSEVSKEIAGLLYAAIVSNTINFQAKVTTERDVKMANWLKGLASLPENFIHEMFVAKSIFDKPIKQVLGEDFTGFGSNQKLPGVAQLELINVDEFVRKNIEEIKQALLEIKQERFLEIIFLTCIDLEKANNTFVVVDESSQKILEDILDIKFKNGVGKREGIIMRKEIMPLMKKIED